MTDARADGPTFVLALGAWWPALGRLAAALEAGAGVRAAYAELLRALVEAGAADPAAAAAADLLWRDNPVSRSLLRAPEPPEGLARALEHDLASLAGALARDWHAESERSVGAPLPPLADLAPPDRRERELADAFRLPPAELLAGLLTRYRRHGAGTLARHDAFRWTGEALVGVAAPPAAHGGLVGLERPLERLAANTERFLDGRPAQHALLYGPRGSGKSTAVRGQLARFAPRGLRLVEVPAERFGDLPRLLEALAGRPHRYLLFVDDLAFEAGDASYRPLRTLLEGSLGAGPAHPAGGPGALVYATSNRRHLVSERFRDRPDPLDDDVHAWDTQHERLALADRFGLVVTFPDADQRRYLRIVAGLLAPSAPGGDPPALDPELAERAVRFADWGNGYSGRTARQFVDLLEGEGRPD